MKRYFHIIEFLLSLSLFVGCKKEDINFSHVSQKTNNEVIPGDIKLTYIGYLTDNVIIGDPSDYRDSNVEEGKITWQYSVIPVESEFPNIESEARDVCYISTETNNYSQIVREIEDRAFINT